MTAADQEHQRREQEPVESETHQNAWPEVLRMPRRRDPGTTATEPFDRSPMFSIRSGSDCLTGAFPYSPGAPGAFALTGGSAGCSASGFRAAESEPMLTGASSAEEPGSAMADVWVLASVLVGELEPDGLGALVCAGSVKALSVTAG